MMFHFAEQPIVLNDLRCVRVKFSNLPPFHQFVGKLISTFFGAFYLAVDLKSIFGMKNHSFVSYF